MNIKNKKSGIVHAPGDAPGEKYMCLCGTLFFPSWSVNEKITCKNCLRILKRNKRLCKYIDCVNYSVNATHYCCAACSADAWDNERLTNEQIAMDNKRKKIVEKIRKDIKICKKQVPFPKTKLTSESLKALLYYTEKHADIYEGTTFNDIVNEMICIACFYEKEHMLT